MRNPYTLTLLGLAALFTAVGIWFLILGSITGLLFVLLGVITLTGWLVTRAQQHAREHADR